MTFDLSFCIYFCENCASYAIDFKWMSKIRSQRGNEFLQPARVDDSLGTAAGLYRCSSRILVPRLCKGQILNVFSFGLVFGVTAAIGCGRDRDTGALLSPPRNAFDLISAPQHNYWHADCSAPVGRITVAVLGWGRTAFTQLFESKLVNIRMNQSAWQIRSALTKLCVSSFFLCFLLLIPKENMSFGSDDCHTDDLNARYERKAGALILWWLETVSFSFSDITEMPG